MARHVRVRQVGYGVYLLAPGGANVYVVETDDGLALVDCGVSGRSDAVVGALASLGLDAGRVADILVTHHHFDHVGSLSELARRTGAAVWAPTGDVPFIRGERRPPPPGAGVTRRLWPLLTRLMPDAEPAAVHHEVDDGVAVPLGAYSRAIATPGHTRGHTSYLLDRDGGMLFVGDAAMNVAGLSSAGRGMFSLLCHDRTQADTSFAGLAELDFETAVFGHGAPLQSGAAERFRRAAAQP